VARAAVPGRLSWRAVTIAATRQETATARTLVLDVPGWPGHLPGQHVVARLTAADGYSSQRDYSIASAPAGAPATATDSAPDSDRVELTVQLTEDGEVSGYLAGIAEPGDRFDLRGPIGGWFVWHTDDTRPLLLVAGGSGIVPLMAMLRTHDQVKSEAPVRLIYSARTPADVIYETELSERSRVSPLAVSYAFTRAAPDGVKTGRINATTFAAGAFPPRSAPAIFVCGPAGFVETAASLLVDAGHDFAGIRTERFG